MKLMVCRECGDVVLMRTQERTCWCGKSRGRYLDDRSTVEQSEGTLSLAIDGRGWQEAVAVFDHTPDRWHPLMMFRAFLNPLSESDVSYVGVPVEPAQSQPKEAEVG